MVGTPPRPSREVSYTGLDDGQIGLSISRVPTPAVPTTTSSGSSSGGGMVAVDLGDFPATATAAALLMEQGHDVGRATSEPGVKAASAFNDDGGSSSHKRAPSEVTVTDELLSSSCAWNKLRKLRNWIECWDGLNRIVPPTPPFGRQARPRPRRRPMNLLTTP